MHERHKKQLVTEPSRSGIFPLIFGPSDFKLQLPTIKMIFFQFFGEVDTELLKPRAVSKI